MAYLNVDLDYFDHPKTVRLVGQLGRGADLLPLRLWAYTGKYHAEKGELTGYSPLEIEAAVKWWGQPGRATEALLAPFLGKPGFLERIEQGFKVHDWDEINGHIAAFKARAKAGAKAKWAKVHAEAMLKQSSSNPASNALQEVGKEGSGSGDDGGSGEEGLRAALVAAFGLRPVTDEEHAELAQAVAFLAAKGAQPADVPAAIAAYRKAWPTAADTLRAILRHFDRFRPKAKVSPTSGAETARAAADADWDRKWLAMSREQQEAALAPWGMKP